MDHWPANSPLSLKNSCLDYFVENIFKFVAETDESYCLKQGISLPQDISDSFLRKLILQTKLLQDPQHNVFGIFNNRANTVLTELNLQYSAVNTEHLKFLCLHPVREIDISYCDQVSLNSYISAINQTSRTLQTLRIGGSVHFQKLIYMNLDPTQLDSGGNDDLDSHNAVFKLPNLRSLFLRDIKFKTLQNMQFAQTVTFLNQVIQPLRQLTHLDLCECQFIKETLDGIGDLALPCLVSLSLCDVLNGCVSALDNLCKLTKLRQLDVSQGDDGQVYVPVVYKNPSDRLKNLVSSMPNLTSLDISGTNLARFTVVQPVSHRLMPKYGDGTMAQRAEKQECSIAGLEGRQFEFLGLLDCSDDASHQKRLPAKKVSGDANELQVMTSLHVYRDKPSLLSRAFNNLLQLFRNDKVNAQCFALEGILKGMERNKHSRHVQIHGSASLVYLVKGEQKHQITQIQKMRICNCVLDAMERHKTEYDMMRNGCRTLEQFIIPDEVMFCYSRLVQIILNVLRMDFDDDYLRGTGILLLGRLARNVEGKHKQAHGDLGTIEVMCDIIKQRLDRQVCDDILEVSWDTLSYVTDKTPRNCERFMDEGGMHLFLHCVKEFPDKEDLLFSMMVLMCNIAAEVAELRPSLVIPEYVKVMFDIIKQRLDRQVCDGMLVRSWITLYYVTGETPRNCERFMDEGGMYLFLRCVKEFPDKEDLLSGMMGVMGNIAEVAELRPSLMIPEYVKVMFDIIKQRLDRQVCDGILVESWRTLCNVTDETPRNCERFMDEGGMHLFLHCVKEFPDQERLLHNMMIVMSNIAEVAELRPSLMIPEYVTVLSDFLDSTKDGIEVSYTAAEVVAHMLSDGPDSWTVSEPTRDQVIHRMVFAIKRWRIDSKRTINYRSFMPILRLVRCFESHASQYWAIWTLCNFTQVYPEKYCKLLQDEGGIELLDAVTRDPRPIEAIKLLATQIIEFIRNRNAQPKHMNGSGLELVHVAGEVNDGIAVDGDVDVNDEDE